MTSLLRAGALLALSIILAGCKLAVIVVEGGEVQSTASGTCSAGLVCINQINDTNFAETYTAVPSPGWQFVKWNSGTGFNCADSTNPDCAISNVGLGGIEAVDAVVASGATFFVMPVFEEIEVGGPRPEYDPNRTDYDGGVDPSMMNRIYWSVDGTPPDPDSNRWFEDPVNRCESSYSALSDAGYYASRSVQRWANSTTTNECVNICSDGAPINSPLDAFNCRTRGESVVQDCSTVVIPGGWAQLSESVHSPAHVECQEDVIFNDPGNGDGQADGFPRDNVLDVEAYSAATAAESDVDWGSHFITLFHANYVDYWNEPSP